MWIGGIQPSHLEIGDFDPWIPLAKATKISRVLRCMESVMSFILCFNMFKHVET